MQAEYERYLTSAKEDIKSLLIGLTQFKKDFKDYKFVGFEQKDKKKLISFAFYLPTKKLKGFKKHL